MKYKTGYAVGIWGALLVPLSLTLAVFGYCLYRFRETKAQSFGQFLEMRYGSKPLRVFASFLRTAAELLAHSIMPAIAARFFMYYLGFPEYILICGYNVSVFVLTMIICLTLAIFIICCGGILSIVITDTIQGMLCMPIMVLICGYLLCKFNWGTEIVPVLMDRAAGQSFVNPYSVAHLRDFNLFTLLLSAMTLILHRASWLGGGASGAAKSPHEQKMASILSTWRGFFSPLLYVLLSLSVLVVLNHEKYSSQAKDIRTELSHRVVRDIIQDKTTQEKVLANFRVIPEQKHRFGVDAPLSDNQNLETIYIDTARKSFEGLPNAAYLTQQFRTLYQQTMMSITMRHVFGIGLMGLFCLLAILAMVSTDDSFIFSSTQTIVQDMILPFFKNPPSFRLHILLIRLVTIGIGILFLFCSCFLAQIDYIELFITIILSVYLGGCGPMMIFGLYSRFGTKAGAWSSLLSGMLLSLTALFLQRNWSAVIYPFLEKMKWTDTVGNFLERMSAPFHPIVIWKMNPEKFPINSYESYFLTMVVSLLVYIAVSYFTCRQPFNLEKMLHRGIYNVDGNAKAKIDWRWSNLLRLLAGITDEHTTGDRILSWSMVIYSYVYQFFFCFLLIILWNTFSPWSEEWWSKYFLLTNIIVPAVLVLITAVWFTIGGITGIRQIFHDLKNRIADPLDNGMVQDGISLADKAKFKILAEKDEEKES